MHTYCCFFGEGDDGSPSCLLVPSCILLSVCLLSSPPSLCSPLIPGSCLISLSGCTFNSSSVILTCISIVLGLLPLNTNTLLLSCQLILFSHLPPLTDTLPSDPLQSQYDSWLSLVDHLNIKAFVNLTLADTVRHGVQHLLFISGLGQCPRHGHITSLLIDTKSRQLTWKSGLSPEVITSS